MAHPWSPQPGPQAEAIAADWCPELLYGGARGGGKTDYLLGDWLQDVETYGALWQGIAFRRTYDPELRETMRRAHQVFPDAGGSWSESDREWRWSNGAILRLRYLERPEDAQRYQGHAYTWIGWDELTQWPSDEGYRKMFATLRSAGGPVPTKRVRSTANPGGAGHQWVKARLIDPAPGGFRPFVDDVTGIERMFIPSRVWDNRLLLAADPGYADRLRGVGSAALVRAWLDGDWSVIEGAFFDCWRTDLHVVEPHELPAHWTRFRTMDWGSAKPFSVGWYAVSDGELPQYPRGALIRYREWYGSKAPNVGLKLTTEEVADGIVDRERGDKITYGKCDPSMFIEDGGPSIAETMFRYTKRTLSWQPADNKRLPGWTQVRQRLVGFDGRPMLYVFSTCTDLIRTLPALQHDEKKPEDVDTEGEDHAGDELRYACMSRPFTAPIPLPLPNLNAPKGLTFAEVARRAKDRQKGRIR